MYDLSDWEGHAIIKILIWRANQLAHPIQNHNWTSWVISRHPTVPCEHLFDKLISPG